MLVAFWQVQRLTREIHDLQKQAMDKQTELSNYQKYAGVLGGSSIINAGNIAGLSRKLVPRATLFAQYAEQASSMSAMQNLQQMKMMGMVPFIQGNPTMQMQIEMSAYNQLKEQARKSLKQQEAAILGEREKEIQLELNSLEVRLKTKEKQLEQYKQLTNKKIEDTVATFGLR